MASGDVPGTWVVKFMPDVDADRDLTEVSGKGETLDDALESLARDLDAQAMRLHHARADVAHVQGVLSNWRSRGHV